MKVWSQIRSNECSGSSCICWWSYSSWSASSGEGGGAATSGGRGSSLEGSEELEVGKSSKGNEELRGSTESDCGGLSTSIGVSPESFGVEGVRKKSAYSGSSLTYSVGSPMFLRWVRMTEQIRMTSRPSPVFFSCKYSKSWDHRQRKPSQANDLCKKEIWGLWLQECGTRWAQKNESKTWGITYVQDIIKPCYI